jgi:hypothetical protein
MPFSLRRCFKGEAKACAAAMDRISDAVLAHLFAFLACREHCRMGQVSRRLRAICRRPSSTPSVVYVGDASLAEQEYMLNIRLSNQTHTLQYQGTTVDFRLMNLLAKQVPCLETLVLVDVPCPARLNHHPTLRHLVLRRCAGVMIFKPRFPKLEVLELEESPYAMPHRDVYGNSFPALRHLAVFCSFGTDITHGRLLNLLPVVAPTLETLQVHARCTSRQTWPCMSKMSKLSHLEVVEMTTQHPSWPRFIADLPSRLATLVLCSPYDHVVHSWTTFKLPGLVGIQRIDSEHFVRTGNDTIPTIAIHVQHMPVHRFAMVVAKESIVRV